MDILSSEEKERYGRQIIIPLIGEEGQKKLKRSRVFIAGVGGLGSISSFYLAAAGIGRIRIVDKDRVALSNLNRQILHWTVDLERDKIDSAIEKLTKLNPNVRLEGFVEEIREENIERLFGDSEIIIDATDNIETRRILNRLAIKKKVPFIYGGVDGLSGMVTTFFPPLTPCFECVFGNVRPQKRIFGILGPLPGIIASIQSLEAIKYILGLEGMLYGRLLFFSGEEMRFSEIKINRNPECEACKESK